VADLYTASNAIVGTPTATSGIRYYSNWATGSAPGADAPYALTIKRKIEAPPPIFTDDPANDFPGLFIERLGWPNVTVIEGQQYRLAFGFKLHLVEKATANTRPKEVAHENICKLVDNIMASDKLGLSYLITVDFQGIDGDTELASYLAVLHPEYGIGAANFSVIASCVF
jgi:hypothetical protein